MPPEASLVAWGAAQSPHDILLERRSLCGAVEGLASYSVATGWLPLAPANRRLPRVKSRGSGVKRKLTPGDLSAQPRPGSLWRDPESRPDNCGAPQGPAILARNNESKTPNLSQFTLCLLIFFLWNSIQRGVFSLVATLACHSRVGPRSNQPEPSLNVLPPRAVMTPKLATVFAVFLLAIAFCAAAAPIEPGTPRCAALRSHASRNVCVPEVRRAVTCARPRQPSKHLSVQSLNIASL